MLRLWHTNSLQVQIQTNSIQVSHYNKIQNQLFYIRMKWVYFCVCVRCAVLQLFPWSLYGLPRACNGFLSGVMLVHRAWVLQLASYSKHIVVKLIFFPAERSLAGGINGSARAIIIGSEHTRNCLQLLFPYSWHCWVAARWSLFEYAACFFSVP